MLFKSKEPSNCWKQNINPPLLSSSSPPLDYPISQKGTNNEVINIHRYFYLSLKLLLFALNAFINAVETALKKGDKVQLVGFGSFEVRKRAPRKGRNPQTKEEIKIPASKAPVFKAGKPLKDLVNKK